MKQNAPTLPQHTGRWCYFKIHSILLKAKIDSQFQCESPLLLSQTFKEVFSGPSWFVYRRNRKPLKACCAPWHFLRRCWNEVIYVWVARLMGLLRWGFCFFSHLSEPLLKRNPFFLFFVCRCSRMSWKAWFRTSWRRATTFQVSWLWDRLLTWSWPAAWEGLVPWLRPSVSGCVLVCVNVFLSVPLGLIVIQCVLCPCVLCRLNIFIVRSWIVRLLWHWTTFKQQKRQKVVDSVPHCQCFN